MKKLILILLFPLMANAGIVEDVKTALKPDEVNTTVIQTQVVDGSGCEIREWIDGAFVGCFGSEAPKIDDAEKRLQAKGFRVVRQGKALVVAK